MTDPRRHDVVNIRTVINSFAVRIALLPLAGALLTGGCASSSDDAANSIASNTSVVSADTTPGAQATEVPERSNTGAQVKPPAGFGNAQGRVLWNEKPASGIKVQLCQSVSFIGGCTGKTYAGKTDKDGNYTIDKVPPGDYGLAVQVFDTDMFVYPTNGVLSAAKYTITNGETLDIRATNLFKLDLQTVSPKVGETVKTGSPILTWKPYPDAATYKIRLSAKGGGDSQELETAGTKVAPETPLLNGSFAFEVTALNANGVKIAETREDTSFQVTGQTGSAKVLLDFPRTDQAVAGSGLVFKWQKHPLANGYQIYLNAEKTTQAILAFEKVDGLSYPLTQTLSPGLYFWSVNAMRDGKKIAASDLQSFRVK